MADNNVKKSKGPAYTQPDHIKPKSKWTKKTTIWTIVIAVIVLGILAIIGANEGWFKTQEMINGKIELEDYSVIDIEDTLVNVDDASVESVISSIISHETTYEEVTEGIIEDGDQVNIDFSGVLEGEEEPFEGGTSEGYSLTIGSGSMIDGFEEKIIGHEVGETFDIDVIFPEDYQSEDLAGKNATFTITVNSKTLANVPELDDELAEHYAEEHYGTEDVKTVEELRSYIRDNIYNNNLESAIMNSMTEKSKVIYYNEADLANLTDYYTNMLSYEASSYGYDASTLASLYGYESANEYASGSAKNTLNQTMIWDKVAEEQGITVTDEEMDEALSSYIESQSFSGTLEEFKEQSGASFLFLVRETEVLRPKVIEYLKQNVNIIETPEEETEASEDASEDADENADENAEKAADETEDETESVTEAETETETEAETETETEASDDAEAEESGNESN